MDRTLELRGGKLARTGDRWRSVSGPDLRPQASGAAAAGNREQARERLRPNREGSATWTRHAAARKPFTTLPHSACRADAVPRCRICLLGAVARAGLTVLPPPGVRCARRLRSRTDPVCRRRFDRVPIWFALGFCWTALRAAWRARGAACPIRCTAMISMSSARSRLARASVPTARVRLRHRIGDAGWRAAVGCADARA